MENISMEVMHWAVCKEMSPDDLGIKKEDNGDVTFFDKRCLYVDFIPSQWQYKSIR